MPTTMNDVLKRCVKCTAEIPTLSPDDTCYACRVEERKIAAMIAMDKFLSEPNHEKGVVNWAGISREELDYFQKIVGEMVEAKWGRDRNGDLPVQVLTVNLGTNLKLHFRPVPDMTADGWETKLGEFMRIANLNSTIAHFHMKVLFDHLLESYEELVQEEAEAEKAVQLLRDSSGSEDVFRFVEEHIQKRRDASKVGKVVGWNADEKDDSAEAGKGEEPETSCPEEG